MFKTLLSGCILIASSIISTSAIADVAINGTRIIFNAKDRQAVAQLKNNGRNPYLLQLWIDAGNPKEKPGAANVPFIINPPVVRIDPNKGQAVRIMFTDAALPQDRETLYWFNMLEVPPKPTSQIESGNNLLQLAFRTRIKLFYRPANLQTSPLDAYKNLKFALRGNTLTIQNHSPYFITFSRIELRQAKNAAATAAVEKFPQRMLAPKGEMALQLTPKKATSMSGLTLFYSVINDYGGETKNEQALPQ